MVREQEIRDGEKSVPLPPELNAGLYYIGRIHTPWTHRLECPRQGRLDGPICRVEVFEPWSGALDSIASCEQLEILYWLHKSRRDLILQSPANDGSVRGTFALRSPARPNPIGTSIVTLISVDGPILLVKGLDCLDQTPLLDLKPERAKFKPIASPQKGDFMIG